MGTGGESTVFEAFAAFGQLLPFSSFLQVQTGAELPAHPDAVPRAYYLRTAIGRTFSAQGGLGRQWSPIVEIIGDRDLKVAQAYDMIHPNATAKVEGRTAADNATIRSVFIVGPDKKIKLILTYPMSTGRNFDEVLRVLDSLQLTAKHKVATPVNWKAGQDVIIVPAVSDAEAKQKYPDGWKAPKPYLRIVPQPK